MLRAACEEGGASSTSETFRSESSSRNVELFVRGASWSLVLWNVVLLVKCKQFKWLIIIFLFPMKCRRKVIHLIKVGIVHLSVSSSWSIPSGNSETSSGAGYRDQSPPPP